jgi:predicted esterase
MRPLLLLLLLALSSTSCLYAVQTPLRFEGRPYVVAAPRGAPRGVLVFLHGLSAEPWIEEQEGIRALCDGGVAAGYVVVVPFAERACSDHQRCWPTRPDGRRRDARAFAEVVPGLERLVRQVERRLGARRRLERNIVGFSNGAFFLAGAVERGLLSRWARVGVVAGGPLAATPQQGSTSTTLPKGTPALFLASFADDGFQGPSMVALEQRWQAQGRDVALVTQPGGHVWSAEHATAFLARFLPP